eukprot:1145423-Pelagomonas_calceolata.AAC.6
MPYFSWHVQAFLCKVPLSLQFHPNDGLDAAAADDKFTCCCPVSLSAIPTDPSKPPLDEVLALTRLRTHADMPVLT